MITTPSLRSAICGITILHNHQLLLMLLPMILSKASSPAFAVGPYTGLAAALQTRMSIFPHRFMVASTSCCNCSFCAMLQGREIASKPLPVNSLVTSSQAAALRLEITTLAPAFAISSAMHLPIPLVEPVISATFPVSSNMLRSWLDRGAIFAPLDDSCRNTQWSLYGPAFF
jgi:hypothetical protein